MNNRLAGEVPVERRVSRPALALTVDELQEMPSKLLRELTIPTMREFGIAMRGQRNHALTLLRHQRERAERLERELYEARGACRRMAEQLRVQAG